MENHPLISCICITNNRIALLKKAINCFKNQDYPNKELLISYPQRDRLTKHMVNSLASDLSIIGIERSDQTTLGDARNQAIVECDGSYICAWDDDDWYHENRLSYQFDCMHKSGNNYEASILNRLILFDQTTQKAYLSFYYTWEGTLLCKKDIFLHNQYSSKNKGEDSDIVDFLDNQNMLYHIPDVPFLYVYIYHRSNTWNYAHFKSFFKRSEELTEEVSIQIRQLIN